jgi:putative redox protein
MFLFNIYNLYNNIPMATVETIYLGGLRTQATHVQSGTEIITDAPTDNQGKGEAFSPTDLLAASLGSCMLTTIAIRHPDINIVNAKCATFKIMVANPRRVGEIQIVLQFPGEYSADEKQLIEKAAMTCPVYESLHPDLIKTVDFGW